MSLGIAALFAPASLADTDLGTVGGIDYVADQTASIPSPGSGMAQAQCPAGSKLLGGGVRNPGFGATSHINGAGPTKLEGPAGGFLGFVYNNDGSAHVATVHAVCDVGGKSKFRKKVGETTSAPDSLALKVSCKKDEHVSGGGVFITGPTDEAFINSSYPIDSHDKGKSPDDGWRVRVHDTAGAGKTVNAYAICTHRSWRYPQTEDTIDPGDEFGLLVACKPNAHLVSAGIRFTGDPGEAVVRTIDPFDSLDDDMAPDDGADINVANSPAGTTKDTTRWAVCTK